MGVLDFSEKQIRVMSVVSVIVYLFLIYDRSERRSKMTKETTKHKILYYLQLLASIVLIVIVFAKIYNPQLWKVLLEVNVILIIIELILWAMYDNTKN